MILRKLLVVIVCLIVIPMLTGCQGKAGGGSGTIGGPCFQSDANGLNVDHSLKKIAEIKVGDTVKL